MQSYKFSVAVPVPDSSKEEAVDKPPVVNAEPSSLLDDLSKEEKVEKKDDVPKEK